MSKKSKKNRFEIINPEQGLTACFPRMDRVNLYGLTDIHIGQNEFDEKKFLEAIRTIVADPYAKVFLNGDIIECIPPNYDISEKGQNIDNDEQLLLAEKYLAPIRDKIIFIRGGNHDTGRSMRMLGFDIVKVMASHLEVPYYPAPGYTKIQLKTGEMVLASGHGFASSGEEDREIKKMKRIYPDADVYYLGHNHQLYAVRNDSLRLTPGGEQLKPQWLVRGGSFSRYAAYARERFFTPSPTGYVVIEFDGKQVNCRTVF